MAVMLVAGGLMNHALFPSVLKSLCLLKDQIISWVHLLFGSIGNRGFSQWVNRLGA